MLRRLALLALLSVWLAIPAFAQTSIDGFSNCPKLADMPGSADSPDNVGSGTRLCFDFDSGFSTGDSAQFVVSENATIHLDPDRRGTAGSAVVDIQTCPSVDASTDNVCVDTGRTLSLTNPAEAVVKGQYRLEVTTAAAGTEDAQVVIRGYPR